MKKLIITAMFVGLATLGCALPLSAQSIPAVAGLHEFTKETDFLSLDGYLRWQYFMENNIWISRAESASLVKSQTAENATAPAASTPTPAATTSTTPATTPAADTTPAATTQ